MQNPICPLLIEAQLTKERVSQFEIEFHFQNTRSYLYDKLPHSYINNYLKNYLLYTLFYGFSKYLNDAEKIPAEQCD